MGRDVLRGLKLPRVDHVTWCYTCGLKARRLRQGTRRSAAIDLCNERLVYYLFIAVVLCCCLVTHDHLFLGVQQSLSRLTLAAHHELGSEMPCPTVVMKMLIVTACL